MPPIPTLATIGGVTLVPGFVGQVAETGPTTVRSMMNESATAIDFGRAVAHGVATVAGVTDNCKPPGADGDVIVGLSVRNPEPLVATTDGTNTITYARYMAVPVMTDGVMFVLAAESGIVEGTAAISITAGGGTIGGVSGAGGVAGTGRVAIPGCIWLDTTALNAIGRVRIKNSST
jgi:hypothetical protein